LLELTSPAPLAPGRLRLLEPEGSSESALLKQLIDGTYDKPFIEDCGPLRYLHFDLDNVQSVMRHDDPDALCLAYTRKMMTFLLFNAEPRRVVLLGLGGGSLAKFCYRHLPGAHITVLEIDPNVLALREEFHVPPDDERFRVVQGDGVAYIGGRAPGTNSERAARADVILVDACDRHGLSPTLAAPDLYANLRRRLAVGGVLVMNVCGEPEEIESHIARIRGVFGDGVPDRAQRMGWRGAGQARSQAGGAVWAGLPALRAPDGLRDARRSHALRCRGIWAASAI
jgi:spermidine synthase